MDECSIGRYRLREFGDENIGWLFPMNSILKRLFNRFLMKHRENGIIQKLQAHYFKSAVYCQTDSFNQIDLMTLSTLFGLLLFGIIVAVFTTCIEKYLHKFA